MMADGAALLKNRRDMPGVGDLADFFQTGATCNQTAFDIGLGDGNFLAVEELLDGLLQVRPARLVAFEIVAHAIVDAPPVANAAPSVEDQCFGGSPGPGHIENE